ncbi:Unknown protein [Striga hermonthica]|uniref:phosphopantothenoylcysteine decarboxylase n=1 Tax=Striga hermonthica TaxID=68872 RepID=A0A9N7N3B3_STRHE|nr:Unknown protein [Striga hermonthica]
MDDVAIQEGERWIVVAACGSDSVRHLRELCEHLRGLGRLGHRPVNVAVVCTKSALQSLNWPPVSARGFKFYTDDELLKSMGPDKLNFPPFFGTLWNQAACLVVAPLSANTMAKVSNGMCDNLLTSFVKSWPCEGELRRPIIFCPDVGEGMWAHPVTQQQVDTLQEWGFVVKPQGSGLMADVEIIARLVGQVMGWND